LILNLKSFVNTGPGEYSYEQSVKYDVDEVTLRHVHIHGRNTTKKTMTCNF